MAYPAHLPTAESRKQVELMAGRFLPHDDIAAIIGVSDETLRKHYRAELDKGKAMGDLDISDRLHKKAKEGHVAALIFLAKIRMGWSEKVRLEHTGKDGAPLNAYLAMGEDALRRRLEELNDAQDDAGPLDAPAA
jgi:hypothetical protein